MAVPDPIDFLVRHPVPVGTPRRRGIERLSFRTAATPVSVPGVEPGALLPPGYGFPPFRHESLRLFDGRLWMRVAGPGAQGADGLPVAQAIRELTDWLPHRAPSFVAPAGYAGGSWPDGPDSDGTEEFLPIAASAMRDRVAKDLVHDGRHLYEALCVPHLRLRGEDPTLSWDWRREGSWIPTLPLGRPDLVEGCVRSLPWAEDDPSRADATVRAAAAVEAGLRAGFSGRTEGEDDIDAFFCTAALSLASCLVSTRVRRTIPEGIAPGIGRLAVLGSLGAIWHDDRESALGTIEATARFCVAEGSQPYIRDIASGILRHTGCVIRPRLATLRVDTTDDADLSTLVP